MAEETRSKQMLPPWTVVPVNGGSGAVLCHTSPMQAGHSCSGRGAHVQLRSSAGRSSVAALKIRVQGVRLAVYQLGQRVLMHCKSMGSELFTTQMLKQALLTFNSWQESMTGMCIYIYMYLYIVTTLS